MFPHFQLGPLWLLLIYSHCLLPSTVTAETHALQTAVCIVQVLCSTCAQSFFTETASSKMSFLNRDSSHTGKSETKGHGVKKRANRVLSYFLQC